MTVSKKALTAWLAEYRGDTSKAKDLKAAIDSARKGRDIEAALDLASKAIEGHGVEVINGNGPGGFWQEVVLAYVNMGDTYARTLCYQPDTGRFFLGSYGDWVEKNGEEYEVD